LSSHSTTDDLEVIEYGLEGAVFGAVLGMIAGGMIGANHKTEKWTDVELESISMSFGAGHNGDIALMLSVHF